MGICFDRIQQDQMKYKFFAKTVKTRYLGQKKSFLVQNNIKV